MKELMHFDQEKLITICMPLFEGLLYFNKNNTFNENKNILLNKFRNSLILANSFK